MNLANQVAEIQLAELFGPRATVTDVEFVEGFIHFSLPVNEPQDFDSVNCTISGIHDGKLECLITADEVKLQIGLRTALKTFAKDFFKNLNHEKPDTLPRTEG